MSGTKPRIVVCAAIRHAVSQQIITGPRHCDNTMRATIRALAGEDSELANEWYKAEAGFIDQFGVFMTRQEAWVVAFAAGQIVYRCGGDETNGGTLYSENLY